MQSGDIYEKSAALLNFNNNRARREFSLAFKVSRAQFIIIALDDEVAVVRAVSVARRFFRSIFPFKLKIC